MKRSLLFIVMAIGFVAAYVGGATFAPFTAETVATGNATAGTLSVDDPTLTLSWTSATLCGNLAPHPSEGEGDVCEGTASFSNSGTLAGVIVDDNGEDPGVGLAISNVQVTGGNLCTADDWSIEAFSEDTNNLQSDSLFPEDDTHNMKVYIYLIDTNDDDINRCQGASVSFDVTVSIQQASDPHSTSDVDD